MIVCHCHAVNDRRIAKAVRRGATDIDAVARACKAGSGCGGCHELIERIIDEHAVRMLVSPA